MSPPRPTAEQLGANPYWWNVKRLAADKVMVWLWEVTGFIHEPHFLYLSGTTLTLRPEEAGGGAHISADEHFFPATKGAWSAALLRGGLTAAQVERAIGWTEGRI